MKYKKGDKVLLEAEITHVNDDGIYPYEISIVVGKDIWVDDYCCAEDAIVTNKNNEADFTYYNILKELLKLDYYVVLEMFGFDESDRFKNREELIGQIVYQYNMEETISVYEHYINYSVVKEGDVITYLPNGKLYLVTKIEHDTYYMISDDMTTKSIEYKHGGKMPLKEFTKMESGITINKFFER